MTFSLAPLAGFTDAPFRRLCFEGGADLCYTEMVSAAGLAHGSSPTRHLMELMPGEGPVACQLFGAKESDLAFAAREVEKVVQAARAKGEPTFVALNLNAGCPMTKVTREGAGAKLVQDPARIGLLLKAMAENTSLPVTLKTRLGPHPKSVTIFEILAAAEEAGAASLALHARFTSQMHGGEVHLDLLQEVVSRAHIPVVGNGSVIDVESARSMAATGVSGLMIGRAALTRPSLFAELKHALGGAATHLAYVTAFRRQLAERFPADHVPDEDAFTSLKARTHLFRYFGGRPGAAALRARFNQVRTLSEIKELIHDV